MAKTRGDSLKLRVPIIQLYENVVAKLKTTKGWFIEIKWNISVKQGWTLSPTLFRIYIDKLEDCLEVVGYDGLKLANMFILFPFMLMILLFLPEAMMILTNNLKSSMITTPIWVWLLILTRLSHDN